MTPSAIIADAAFLARTAGEGDFARAIIPLAPTATYADACRYADTVLGWAPRLTSAQFAQPGVGVALRSLGRVARRAA